MDDFEAWWEEQEIFVGEAAMANAEEVWEAAAKFTATRCKEIAQQYYLSKEAAFDIKIAISNEFKVPA